MTGKIFINYRRGDDPGNTGRLFDRLQEAFQAEQLFMDVDSIAPGLDFVQVLEEQVAQCDVLLAVIGKGWIDARDAAGARYIDNPQDFVRIELESALRQGKRVIPVLMHEARLPRSDELPEAIRPLARRNAVRLTHERFRSDVQALIKALQQILKEAEVFRATEVEGARQAEAEAQRKREETAAHERAQLQREADEQARLEREQARLPAIAVLSPEQIAKAEELANWDFIKESSRADDFREHLARFPGGACALIAQRKLEALEEKVTPPSAKTPLAAVEQHARNQGLAAQPFIPREVGPQHARARIALAVGGVLAAVGIAGIIYSNSSSYQPVAPSYAPTTPAPSYLPATPAGAPVVPAGPAVAPAEPPGMAVNGPGLLTFAGPYRGPFNPSRIVLKITATGAGPHWSASATGVSWLHITPSEGDFGANNTAEVVLTLAPPAYWLVKGRYDGEITFESVSGSTKRAVRLDISTGP